MSFSMSPFPLRFGSRQGGGPGIEILYEDDFSADTSGEWSRGSYSVNGTIAVAGGVLVHTQGSSDGAFPRWVRSVTGLTIGKTCTLGGVFGGTATTKRLVAATSSDGQTGLFAQLLASGTIEFTAPAATIYLALTLFNATAGQTGTLDDAFLSIES